MTPESFSVSEEGGVYRTLTVDQNHGGRNRGQWGRQTGDVCVGTCVYVNV